MLNDMRLIRLASMCAALLFLSPLRADSVIHKFEMWGSDTTPTLKLFLYWGWSNGFFQGRGKPGAKLLACVEALSYNQAIAMIDKRYKEHPEFWSRPIGEQILNTLTDAGAPCAGMNPFDSVDK